MKQKKILILVINLLLVSLLFIAYVGYWWQSDINLKRTQLLRVPDPIPNWIVDIGPNPADIVKFKFIYGNRENDTFSPIYGNVCVQLNSQIINITHPSDYHNKVKLSINGLPLQEIDHSWMVKGIFITKGYVLAAYVKNSTNYNICWRVNELEQVGDYLASLNIVNANGNNLYYEWAFTVKK